MRFFQPWPLWSNRLFANLPLSCPACPRIAGLRRSCSDMGHHRQVIRHQINQHGPKHKEERNPEAPIMVRPFPVRVRPGFVVAVLQFFTDVHICLQLQLWKNGLAMHIVQPIRSHAIVRVQVVFILTSD